MKEITKREFITALIKGGNQKTRKTKKRMEKRSCNHGWLQPVVKLHGADLEAGCPSSWLNYSLPGAKTLASWNEATANADIYAPEDADIWQELSRMPLQPWPAAW